MTSARAACRHALLLLAALTHGCARVAIELVPDAGSAPDAISADALAMLTGTIWYVRRDGGNRTQCDGLTDGPYSGSGDHQHCAFGDVRYLWTDGSYGNKAWVISGGDAVIVRDGPWRVGYNGPNSGDSFGNDPGDPYSAGPPPVPSGTAAHPTRIYGEHWASCSAKTQLFGGFAVGHVLSLNGSHDVELSCLELTDHAQCTHFGMPALPSPCASSYPLDDFASNGIITDHATADITLREMDLHGFTSRGIIGPLGGLFSVERVRIGFNAGAGWDLDDGANTPSAPGARIDARALTIEWSGCNEEYPIRSAVPAISCYDANHAGYGDGLGTSDTALDLACDRCTFRYNTQDGLDVEHVNGSRVVVTHSQSYGNMGQQWKFGAEASLLFRDNIAVHNCHRLAAAFPGAPAGYNAGLSLFCGGNHGAGVALRVAAASEYHLEANTLVGYGPTAFDLACPSSACTGAVLLFQNNIIYGYPSPTDAALPVAFQYTGFARPPWSTIGHSLYFNTRACPTDSDPGASCVDPRLVATPAWAEEATLDHLDLHPAPGSPAIGRGAALAGVSDDVTGRARANPPAIGAYEP